MTKQELLLVMLMEECDELSQRASKALRFGLDEVQQGQELDNADRIIYEFNDLVSVMELIFSGNYDRDLLNYSMINLKKMKIKKWIEYSKLQGTLTDTNA